MFNKQPLQPKSKSSFDFFNTQLLKKIERNSKFAIFAAFALILGSVIFIVSRFINQQTVLHLALGIGGLTLFGLGSLALFLGLINWSKQDKCPACGNLFWGTRLKTRTGFNPFSQRCMYCQHDPIKFAVKNN
jgi:hypothetical protein